MVGKIQSMTPLENEWTFDAGNEGMVFEYEVSKGGKHSPQIVARYWANERTLSLNIAGHQLYDIHEVESLKKADELVTEKISEFVIKAIDMAKAYFGPHILVKTLAEQVGNVTIYEFVEGIKGKAAKGKVT
jgi:hypothetical protein